MPPKNEEISSARLGEALVDASLDPLYALALDGKILSWNWGAETVLGYSRQEAVGRLALDLNVPAERADEFRAGVRECLETGSSFVESARRRKDGTLMQVLCSQKLVRDEGGEPSYVAVYEKDVTDSKRLEEELFHRVWSLTETQALLRSILEGSIDYSIVALDLAGKIQSWNVGAAQEWGLSEAEATGKESTGLFDSTGPAAVPWSHALSQARERGRFEGELRCRRADGRAFPARAVVNIRKDPHGQPIGFVLVSRDVTAEKKAQEVVERFAAELQRSNRELELFAYVASHDLQEPLRMVASFVQLLARRYKGRLDADADEYIKFAYEGAARMQALINDLLSYSRVSTQAKPHEPVQLEKMLEGALQNLQLAVEDSKAVVTHDPLPGLTGEPTQLVSLFQNLVGNAIKYRGEAPPHIHIACERQNGDWRLSVRDNGIGIEPRFQDRLFAIFQRFHSREKYPGTGIGLAVCKKIVERHGGRIWCESKPGEGTTFHFTLPVQGVQPS